MLKVLYQLWFTICRLQNINTPTTLDKGVGLWLIYIKRYSEPGVAVFGIHLYSVLTDKTSQQLWRQLTFVGNSNPIMHKTIISKKYGAFYTTGTSNIVICWQPQE